MSDTITLASQRRKAAADGPQIANAVDLKAGKRNSLQATDNKFVKKTLTTVFVALLIDILAFTIILPLYPRILEHYDKVDGGDKTSLYYQMHGLVQRFRQSIGVSGQGFDIILFGGALGSLFSFLQFVSSPVIGKLSDRYGRRTVLLTSMIGNGVSMLLWIFSKSFGVFVWSRIIGGLTEGNVQMSIAVISDITTAETRSRGLALVGIAFSLGFTVGPPLGAYFTSMDIAKVFPFLEGLPINQYSGPALFAFILIVIETVYLAIALPETKGFKSGSTPSDTDIDSSPATRRSTRLAEKRALSESTENLSIASAPSSVTKSAPSLLSPRTPPKLSRLNTLSLIHFLFLFCFSGLEFTLTFLTHDRFGFSHARQGRLLGFMGITSAFVQGGYTRRVAHKLVSERGIAAQGMFAAAVGLAIQGLLAWSVGWLYVGAAFLAFTSGTVVTALTALASYETGRSADGAEFGSEEDDRDGAGKHSGSVLGKFRSVGQLGRSLGPMFACTCYWVLGSAVTYSAVACGMLAIGLITLGFVRARPLAGGEARKKRT
ncbi:major facilitator superfamily domain-containing protein [Fimicolochytrium jonesii]|uniref:major facilitator superfamily domain-containing protein n=1 Tax=Fimicolochytrium jonesii TaxID=1396493 RepID=UPI0022FDB229|nr:major facilitator superfamily domain-containing protein [Fimicolochytrium jonesii]KAI8822999.1 major facilitator superfamily domain-containing protein [Fimicolochytrium jonesii]